MYSFKNHYAAYLGINQYEFNKGSRVFYKVLKYNVFPGYFYYNLIITKFDSEKVISINPDFAKNFDNSELSKILSLNEDSTLKFLKQKFPEERQGFFIKKMLRFSMNIEEFKEIKFPQKVELLNSKHKRQYLSRFNHLDPKIQEMIWTNVLPLIGLKRSFIAASNHECFSVCQIGNIIDNGGNIGVGTPEKFRNKGYGKSTVTKAAKWCFEHNVIPIYLVDSVNIRSINLAKSLGFNLKSTEIVIRSEPYSRN